MKNLIYLSIAAMFMLACAPDAAEKKLVAQDTSLTSAPKAYIIGNCVFSNTASDNENNCIDLENIRYQSMAGLCSECFQYNDRSISISRQMYKGYSNINYALEINELNIAVKINIVPKGVELTRPYEGKKNAFHYINRGAIIANRAQFLEKLEKTKIFDLEPLSGKCICSGCVAIQIKKNEKIECFTLLIQDTVYQQAVKEVEKLIENELAEAGITF